MPKAQEREQEEPRRERKLGLRELQRKELEKEREQGFHRYYRCCQRCYQHHQRWECPCRPAHPLPGVSTGHR